MAKISAGLLMYRFREGVLEVLLVHPGGPFWAKKDDAAWSVPKGEVDPGEDLLAAAKREFREELGIEPQGTFRRLEPIRQRSGKLVHVWAFAGDCNPDDITSNTFQMEWPPGSGRLGRFPEVDRAAFFDVPTARRKINPAQAPLLDQLEALLAAGL